MFLKLSSYFCFSLFRAIYVPIISYHFKKVQQQPKKKINDAILDF